MPVVNDGMTCAPTLLQDETCEVSCPEGYRVEGRFTCSYSEVVGSSVCVGNEQLLRGVEAVKVAAEMQLTVTMLENSDTQQLEGFLRTSISEAIGVVPTLVTKVELKQLSNAPTRRTQVNSNMRRKLSVEIKLDVSYEIVKPNEMSEDQLLAATTALTESNSPQQEVMKASIASSTGTMQVQEIAPKREPRIFTDEILVSDDSMVDLQGYYTESGSTPVFAEQAAGDDFFSDNGVFIAIASAGVLGCVLASWFTYSLMFKKSADSPQDSPQAELSVTESSNDLCPRKQWSEGTGVSKYSV